MAYLQNGVFETQPPFGGIVALVNLGCSLLVSQQLTQTLAISVSLIRELSVSSSHCYQLLLTTVHPAQLAVLHVMGPTVT